MKDSKQSPQIIHEEIDDNPSKLQYELLEELFESPHGYRLIKMNKDCTVVDSIIKEIINKEIDKD
jgi:hypothetical protein